MAFKLYLNNLISKITEINKSSYIAVEDYIFNFNSNLNDNLLSNKNGKLGIYFLFSINLPFLFVGKIVKYACWWEGVYAFKHFWQ